MTLIIGKGSNREYEIEFATRKSMLKMLGIMVRKGVHVVVKE